jgi:hypothetical protein
MRRSSPLMAYRCTCRGPRCRTQAALLSSRLMPLEPPMISVRVLANDVVPCDRGKHLTWPRTIGVVRLRAF